MFCSLLRWNTFTNMIKTVKNLSAVNNYHYIIERKTCIERRQFCIAKLKGTIVTTNYQSTNKRRYKMSD